jgi:hypothetical protein
MLKIGSRLEMLFKYTGIKWLVKKIYGEDCGCNQRKEFLDNFDNYFNRK